MPLFASFPECLPSTSVQIHHSLFQPFIHIHRSRGQHGLSWDYAYQTIKVDELLLDLRCWNGVFCRRENTRARRSDSCASSDSSSSRADAKKKKKKKKKATGQ